MAPQERIRVVAQQLFAEHGFEGVSVRMITDKARVNIAAINYYYGTKDRLFVEVVRHHMEAVLKARKERLAALRAEADAGRAIDLKRVIEAWLDPTLELFYRDEGPAVVRLAMQLNAVVGLEGAAAVLEPYRDYLEGMYEMVSRCARDLPHDEVAWRFECMTGMIFYAIAQPDWQQRVPSSYCNIGDRELLRRRLTESALALFPAPART